MLQNEFLYKKFPEENFGTINWRAFTSTHYFCIFQLFLSPHFFLPVSPQSKVFGPVYTYMKPFVTDLIQSCSGQASSINPTEQASPSACLPACQPGEIKLGKTWWHTHRFPTHSLIVLVKQKLNLVFSMANWEELIYNLVNSLSHIPNWQD